MSAVTSNSVANSLNSLTYMKNLSASYSSFVSIPRGVYSIGTSIYSNYTDKPSGLDGRIIFIAGASDVNSDEQIAIILCSHNGEMYIGSCYGGTPRYNWNKIV